MNMVLSREKFVVSAGIICVAVLSWVVITTGFGSSSSSMGMNPFQLDSLSVGLFALTWTVGMVAMMFPTSVPMLVMFLNVGRRSSVEIKAGGGPTLSKAFVFVASYLAIWTATGVLIYFALALVFALLPADYRMLITTPLWVGIALLLVGLYQLSPIKGECLNRCHPSTFLYRFYRGGISGAVSMGGQYAKYCVGCCWVMMVFLLLVASMSIIGMALFTGIIFVERTLTNRLWPSKIVGLGFLASGLALIFLL